MLSPFFVVLGSCGFISCAAPTITDFDSAQACTAYVEAFARNSSVKATCFNRQTGEIVFDSKGRK